MKSESFTGKVEVFPDGWVYIRVPTANSNPYLEYRKIGNVPIIAKTGNSEWSTLLWAFGDGMFFITLPAKIRTKQKISAGDNITVQFKLRNK